MFRSLLPFKIDNFAYAMSRFLLPQREQAFLNYIMKTTDGISDYEAVLVESDTTCSVHLTDPPACTCSVNLWSQTDFDHIRHTIQGTVRNL